LRSKASHIKSRARKSAIKKAKGPLPSRDKVRAYRKRMRAKGLRLVQMWLPDTSTPEFKAQAHRDSVAIANSQDEQEMQAFLDSASWWNSEEARALENSEPPVPWWKEPEEGR
jgi:hypothetical protein